MSKKQWVILAVLALVSLILLGGMGFIVVRSLMQERSAPTLLPTLTPSPSALPTRPPTWTPTVSPSPRPTDTPRAMPTPVETRTPWPTFTPTETATPTPTLTATPLPTPLLENSDFDEVRENEVPGWQVGGFVNWTPDQPFDPVASYAAPRFHQADDPRQRINGPTLQIDTEPWVKLRAWMFQAVTVTVDSRVQFQIRARGFVRETEGGYFLKAGIDPEGGEGCDAVEWGEERIVNQGDGVVLLQSPPVTVGEAGRVTVCAWAETQFAQVYHAAFFDEAEIVILPEE